MRRFLAVGLVLALGACDQEADPQPVAPAPAVTRLEVSPATLTVGESATYAWSVGTTDASCALDVNADGTPEYTMSCAADGQSHTFTELGSFTAVLTATAGDLSTQRTAPPVTVTDEGTDTPPGGLSWGPTAVPPYGVAEGQGVSLGGRLYVFGGFDSTFRCCRPTDRAFVFDPASATWSPLAPLPPMNGTGHGGVTHAGFTTDGQNVFFAGGYTSNARNSAQLFSTPEVWRYNVAANAYDRLPDLPEARGAGQLEYLDGKLYFYGGSDPSRRVDTGDLFVLDVVNGATSWTEGAPLPNPRNHLGAAVLGGKIYAVGGQHEHDGRLTTQSDVHAYSPQTDTWQRVADLPLPLSHHSNSTFVMNGRLVVVGGEVDHLKGVTNVFSYSPQTDLWTELTPLPLAMVDPVAENVGGRIVVAYNWRPKAFIGTLE